MPCVQASFCIVTAHACASVCRVAACPRSMLHEPTSKSVGHWEVVGGRCMRVVCGHVLVCACRAVGPHSMCVHAWACACACPLPPGLPDLCV